MQMTKPNLFIIGASKCGTTSLWHMLKQHPDVFLSTPKEPLFFSFNNYQVNLDWYEKLFNKVKTEKFIGEASPIYSETTLIPELPQRIHDYNSEAKIIYIVREPIDRLKSVWRQTLSTGHWQKPVYKKYCDIEVPIMPKDFIKAVYGYPSYIEATKYWTNLNNYRKFFNDKNILLLFFEDLKTNPQNFYSKVCTFLNIEPNIDATIFEKKNDSKGKTMERIFFAQLKQNKIVKYISEPFLKKNKLNLSFFRKTIPYEVKLNDKQKDEILATLKKETTNILKYGEKPSDFWDL